MYINYALNLHDNHPNVCLITVFKLHSQKLQIDVSGFWQGLGFWENCENEIGFFTSMFA